MADASTNGAELHSALPDGWTQGVLEDFLEPNGISYGIVQPGSDDLAGVPIVRVKNLRNGRVLNDDVLKVGPEIEASYSRTRIRGGEVLLSLVGSVGEIAIAPLHLAGWNVARAVAVLRVSDRVSNSWIKTCLSSDLAQHYMRIWQNTTVQATLNLRDVRQLPIIVPPKADRESILALLGALDDKVTANECIAATAEALLRDLFESLSDGSLTAPISQIGRHIREGAKPNSLANDVPHIGLEHMPRKSVWLNSWGTSSEVDSAKSAFLRGDVLFGKLRPYFHKVGLAQVNGICSTDILVVRPVRTTYRAWLLMAMSSDEVIAYARTRSDGTRMPRTKWSDLAEFYVPWGAEDAVGRFEELARPLIERVERGADEQRALASLRSTLLPELMSGRLRVRDAERAVEDAV